MSKLPNITTSIFSVMSQLANEHGAINLSQGFPNFPEDERLLQISERIIRENIHQYTPMAGLPSLLEKIANQTLKQYGRKVNTATEILVTAGATQGVFTAINTFVNQGDEVLILDPSYDSYEPSVLVAGGKPVRVSLNDDYTPMDFVVDVLRTVFRKNHHDAINIMLEIHHKGAGLCGVFTRDVAETKAQMVIDEARNRDYPLQCVVERE